MRGWSIKVNDEDNDKDLMAPTENQQTGITQSLPTGKRDLAVLPGCTSLLRPSGPGTALILSQNMLTLWKGACSINVTPCIKKQTKKQVF